jgi:hypothetical protein
MRRGLVFVFCSAATALVFAACGDGPDAVATSTPTAETTATAASSATQGTLPSPTVPDRNIEAISPAHGEKVPQLDTRSPNRDDPRNGACAQVNFEGLPEQFQWIRMFFDEEEVTVSPDVLLIAPQSASQQTPDGGTICYAPQDGFSVGLHTVTIGIQNPRNPSEPTRQIMQWQFEVVP